MVYNVAIILYQDVKVTIPLFPVVSYVFAHCGDWSEWSSPGKKTIQPEVTSIVCLAEMIKSKPPGEVAATRIESSSPED